MDASGYVILVLLGIEAVTLLVAGIWITMLKGRLGDQRAEICELENRIRALNREKNNQAEKTRLEELNDAAALADFNRHDIDPIVPGSGGG